MEACRDRWSVQVRQHLNRPEVKAHRLTFPLSRITWARFQRFIAPHGKNAAIPLPFLREAHTIWRNIEGIF
jgi:hypothetical protein